MNDNLVFMKLVLYYQLQRIPHRKNYEAIWRMCTTYGIDFETTTDYQRIQEPNYDILLSCCEFIPPEDIPKSIRIIMGPQFFVFPSGPIIGSLNPEYSKRCVYNVLSTWVKEVYLECVPEFIVPMVEFPFSVDTATFCPLPSRGLQKFEYDCIIYDKRRSRNLLKKIKIYLDSIDICYKIFQYGSYNESDYLKALQNTAFMITLDAHESQGFALEEAMSCNVPLLVIDATSMYDELDNGISTYQNKKPFMLRATSVPYWSDECGIKKIETDALEESIQYMLRYWYTFSPRKYILEHLSDQVCMKRILDYFGYDIKTTVSSGE